MRTHATPSGVIPFTPEEEVEWDLKEAANIARAAEDKRNNMVVTRLQARLALRRVGLFDQAQALIDASSDVELKDAWNEALEFKRTSPTLVALGQALGLTDEQLDNLFTTAKGIEV